MTTQCFVCKENLTLNKNGEAFVKEMHGTKIKYVIKHAIMSFVFSPTLSVL